MSEFTFTYGGVTFSVSWGMLFQRLFWEQGLKLGDQFNSIEMLVICIFDGNQVYHKLNGGVPVFATRGDVYKLLEAYNDSENETKIVNEFVQTQTYKSMLPAEPEDGEKKT